jgi:hypothetical protein
MLQQLTTTNIPINMQIERITEARHVTSLKTKVSRNFYYELSGFWGDVLSLKFMLTESSVNLISERVHDISLISQQKNLTHNVERKFSPSSVS